ncbi:trehalase family glycosidase [uncultured Eudoraea sp.]|uniref:MGH1-like glycoside hydrolase domain-containing protein n=1 Tax=uncultured Eudoraea sp. TaxID=1035614 RepID=UPI0026084ADB|nr:trehalase family glycosidase [uncultured Eudoraea sp.]
MSEPLITKAKEILNGNYREPGFTLPSQGLYPFQWNWDSGLIAIGYANYDMERAQNEIRTLLDTQWKNGFIPHITFHRESNTYFPGPKFHQASLHPDATTRYKTTGMIQPPVIGFVLKELLDRAQDKKGALEFTRKVIDKVYENHLYLYNNRDLLGEGLIYIFHNWESGTDNSPIWDTIWETMDSPRYTFERRDTNQVDPSQRPSNREYDHYLALIDLAKKYRYNDSKIAEHSPFLVQDPLVNALLIKSNQSLIKLYQICGFGEDKIRQLEKWQALSIANYESKFYDEDLGAYLHYDLRNKRKIRMLTSSSFVALFAGIPGAKRTSEIAGILEQRFGGEGLYLCASFDPEGERFDPKRYWRGPLWINVNWMLYHGLKSYGINKLAEQIRSDSIEVVEQNGFYEYFDPRRSIAKEGKGGYGGSNFSWTAALYIDFILRES